MSILSSMDLPTIDVDLGPEKIVEEKEGGPMFHCDLCDTEVVHKLAQMFLPGLASACVDSTSGDLFKTPGSVAVDLRKEMIDYVTQRSESFVAESVILEGGPDGEVSDHPFDIISNFVDDFASSKTNLFSRVSGWVLSEKREDKIEDFVQEMEMNGFWTLDRREPIAESFLKNVDFENSFHCGLKFNSVEELANHVQNCNFRPMICENEGCNARFCAGHLKQHDSTCDFKIIPCEQRCSDNIMRRDMDRHCITVCPMKLVNCPFYAVGCRSAIAQCMIEKHRSDDVHSHLWHLLKGTHKEANGEDLQRRVEQILEASSSDRLAQARDVRSLNFIVKDIEAKLGPLKVSAVEKNSGETVTKNDDKEDGNTDTKGSEQSTQPSNMVNSSDKADVGDIVNIDSAENTAKSEDSEHTRIENKDSEDMTGTSNMANLSDKTEIDLVNSNNAQIYKENKDAAASELLMGDIESTQKNLENASDKGEVSAINEDSAQIYKENKDAAVSELLKSNIESTQTNLENSSYKGEISAINEDSAQIYKENKHAAVSELLKGNIESTQTNLENASDKGEISAINEDSAQIYKENKDAAVSELLKSNIESTQTNLENSSYKGEISAINEDSAQIYKENKHAAVSELLKGNIESTQTNLENASDEGETSAINKDSAQIYKEKKDAAVSELLKDIKESTETNLENVSDKGEISAINEDNAENSTTNKYIEDSNFEDKDNEQGIQNSKMDTKGSAENNVKNKDIEDDNLKESIQTSEV